MPIVKSLARASTRSKGQFTATPQYNITGSTLFSGNSYLTKSMTSNGNNRTFTTSFWVRRTALSSSQEIWNAGTSNYFEFYFNSDDSLRFSLTSASRYTLGSRLFRDVGAWIHIVLAIDTTQATAANRRKIYINGEDLSSELTLWSGSEIAQNATMDINTAGVTHRIAQWNGGGAYYTNANLAEFYHIDGRQLAASDFGRTDAATGIWVPKIFSTTSSWTRFAATSGMISTSGVSAVSAANIVDDNSTTTGFHTDGAGVGSYVQFDLGSGNDQAFQRVRIQLNGSSVGMTATWNVQYSDNGSSWTTITTSLNVNPNSQELRKICPADNLWEVNASWTNVGAHRYWRIYKTNGAAGGDYHNGVDFYTLSDTNVMGSCGFYLPLNSQFDTTVTTQLGTNLGDAGFIHSGRSGSYSAFDDRTNPSGASTQGVVTLNNSGGPFNGRHFSGFTQPTSTGSTTGANGFFTGDSSTAGNWTTGRTWMCWIKSTQTGNRNGAWHVKVTAFGDYRGSVYGGFGINNGKVAFGEAAVYEGTTNIADGNWHHIAMTYDGGGSSAGMWRLYADGNIEKTFRSSQFNGSVWPSLILDCVGFTYNYGDNVPDGLADIQYYYRELSPTEVKGIYSGNSWKLGLDQSQNKNHFVGAGTIAATKDSPVNAATTGADTGAGGQLYGTYPILDPLSAFDGSQSFGGLQTTTNDIISTIGVSSGKWYWEYLLDFASDNVGGTAGNVQHFGVTFGNFNETVSSGGIFAPVEGKIIARADNNNQASNGTTISGVSLSGSITHFGHADYVGMALDLDSSPATFRLYKNNSLVATWSFTYNGATAAVPFVRNNGYKGTINFGQMPFRYAAPSGHKCICSTNLSTPAIRRPTTNFDVVAYSGNGAASRQITTAFKPDLVWVKSRSGSDSAFYHRFASSMMPDNNYLSPHTSDVLQNAINGYVDSFDDSGFTITKGGGGINESGSNYVAWAWKAGSGTTSTNTNGSVTSTTSVNNSAGFSIITYAGSQGSNYTVGHGQSAAPNLVITKGLNSTSNWGVYYTVNGTNTNWMQFDSNTGQGSNSASLSGGAFMISNASTLQIDAGAFANSSSQMIAFCWRSIPGFSKIGIYKGNGSSTGPIVWTGFKPAFILRKNITTGGTGYDWVIIDNERNTFNIANNKLYPNLASAENVNSDSSDSGDNSAVDILSYGFKLRAGNGRMNANGQAYLYMAFAENPFKTVRAR